MVCHLLRFVYTALDIVKSKVTLYSNSECFSATEIGEAMDATDIIRAAYDDWNNKDKTSFLSYFTESSEITTSGGLVLRGLAGAEMFWDGWQIPFPDNHLTIRALFGSGEQVAVEGIFGGTHTGPLLAPDGSEIPATGKHVSAPYADFFMVHDDKIAINHLYYDQLELLIQLSLMPAPATSPAAPATELPT